MEDVASFAVRILDQGDVAGAIRVVFDPDDLADNVILATLEVDDSVATLVATTATSHGDLALVVAATLLVERTQKRLLWSLLGHLDMSIDRRISSSIGRWLVYSNRHSARTVRNTPGTVSCCSIRTVQSCRLGESSRWPAWSRASSNSHDASLLSLAILNRNALREHRRLLDGCLHIGLSGLRADLEGVRLNVPEANAAFSVTTGHE